MLSISLINMLFSVACGDKDTASEAPLQPTTEPSDDPLDEPEELDGFGDDEELDRENIKAANPSAPPTESDPVSPMNTIAGGALYQRNPRLAPTNAPQNTASSPTP